MLPQPVCLWDDTPRSPSMAQTTIDHGEDDAGIIQLLFPRSPRSGHSNRQGSRHEGA